jgi:hypothetical protein
MMYNPKNVLTKKCNEKFESNVFYIFKYLMCAIKSWKFDIPSDTTQIYF